MIKLSILAREDGSSMVETSISLILLFTAMFAIMEGSRLLYIYSYVSYSAREGARYAMVRGSTFTGKTCASTTSANCVANSANIAAIVTSLAPPGVNTNAPLIVTPSWPGITAAGPVCLSTNGANSPGCIVQVQVAYHVSSILPLIPHLNLSITNSSAVTISQ